MTDQSEQDDGAVTRAVAQFRRLARLAGADPLRLLPPDPLTGLVSLGAPVAALIDLTPLERLRDALATAATTPAETVRARVQPLVPGSKVRPNAPPPLAERTPRRATQRDTSLSRAAQAAVAALAGDVRVQEDRERGNTTSPGALAERRRALRRSLPQREGSTPQSLAAAALATARAGQPADPPRLLEHERVHRAGEDVSDVDAAPTAPQTPSETEQRAEVGKGRTFLGEGLRAALKNLDAVEATPRPADTPLTPEATTAPAPDTKSESQAGRTIGAGLKGAADVLAPSPAPRPVPEVGSPRPTSTDSPAESARGRRPRAAQAGLEITDELFEALYRSGVDQSWP